MQNSLSKQALNESQRLLYSSILKQRRRNIYRRRHRVLDPLSNSEPSQGHDPTPLHHGKESCDTLIGNVAGACCVYQYGPML